MAAAQYFLVPSRFATHGQPSPPGTYGALVVLEHEFPHGTWRVEKVSSDEFQACEIFTRGFSHCAAALLAGSRAVGSV